MISNICAVYGNNAIEESTKRQWFSCFKEDHFDISDTPHSGRPLRFDEDHLNTLIHNDSCQCTRELEMWWTVTTPPSCDICIQMAMLKKNGCMGTACSKPKPQKNKRVAIYASLLAHHRLALEQHRRFLSCIITGDEKWCLYANIMKKKKKRNGWARTREECVGNVPISTLGTRFSSVNSTTHYLQMTKL